jgi:hypothetical protein
MGEQERTVEASSQRRAPNLRAIIDVQIMTAIIRITTGRVVYVDSENGLTFGGRRAVQG